MFHIFFLVAIFYVSRSDMRSYVWTYEYMITDPGRAEIENYLTLSAPKFSNMKGQTTIEQKIEVEIGMTKHFDFSIYQNFLQSSEKNFHLVGFDFRARFLIGQKNQFFFDPLIYLEYGSNATFSSHKFETKLILAKDIGKFNLALNPIYEIEYDEEIEQHISYALGIRYEWSPLLRTGFEIKGDADAHYFGFVVSHGKENLWVAASPTFLISNKLKNKPEFLLRVIIGIGI